MRTIYSTKACVTRTVETVSSKLGKSGFAREPCERLNVTYNIKITWSKHHQFDDLSSIHGTHRNLQSFPITRIVLVVYIRLAHSDAVSTLKRGEVNPGREFGNPTQKQWIRLGVC